MKMLMMDYIRHMLSNSIEHSNLFYLMDEMIYNHSNLFRWDLRFVHVSMHVYIQSIQNAICIYNKKQNER